jgi:aromatic ring-opening dioxygenase catalytic subunit (LigB family)
MGDIVFAAAVSHAPQMTGYAELAEQSRKERFHAAMREVGKRLNAARPDVLVAVSSDHFSNLSHRSMPAFCIGVADSYRGPLERWLRIDPFEVRGQPEFARALLDTAFRHGLEPSFAHELQIEHGIAVPLSFITPGFDVPVVPVLQNCMVPPLPKLSRCLEFGRLIRLAAQESGLRVAVVGTGGLSHAPGSANSDFIDTDFDNEFLRRLSSGQPAAVLDFSSDRIDAAGFGAWEIRQWVTALGAAGCTRAEVLAYEPVLAWETGCAAVVFDLESNPAQAGAHA